MTYDGYDDYRERHQRIEDRREEDLDDEIDAAEALQPDESYVAHEARHIINAVCLGFNADPGHSDLDDSQPITIRLTLGDYRRALRIRAELNQGADF
jgi:hypothetical protein